jgi:transcriptional regulator with XRE-family HTH domain
MAFNPFHTFRKHQRPLIAALAIFCMVMFVASSGIGRGDAVYQVLGFFGAARGRGSVVATLHGRKITEGELARVRRDRDLASKFLYYVASNGAMKKVDRMIKEQMANRENRNAPPPDAAVNEALGLLSTIYQDREGRFPPAFLYKYIGEALQRVRNQAQLAQITKPESVRSLDELARVLAFELWKISLGRNSKEYYFGGSSDSADLLDFILWEQQADRLGVVLTEADVIAALNREGADENLFSGTSLGTEPLAINYVESNSASRGGATTEQLAQALNREFRYLLAQESVLGLEGGARSVRDGVVPQVPAAETPREFLDWFRERRTTLKVAMLPIPVQHFVDQVKGSPPEATLRELYEAYRADEAAPDRQSPGFKEPRRIRVETVSARSESPFYQSAGRAQAITPAAGALFGGPFGGPVAGFWPAAYDPLWRGYSVYAGETRSWIARGIGVGVDLVDRQPLFAAVAALTIGATPGGILSSGTTAAAENVFYNVGLAKVAGSLLAAGAGSQPLAAIGLPFPYRTTVLPPEKVESALFAKVVDGLAPTLVAKNLDEMVTELAKLKSRPSEAEAYVAKAIKEFGLSHTLMAEPKTSYQLADDPALQGLKSSIEEEALARIRDGDDSLAPDLARTLLSTVGVYDPQRYPPGGRWSIVKEPYVWWRVKDLPAHERPFDVVRPEVESAWRIDQARALARAVAERVEAAVKKNVAANKSAAEAVKVLRSFGPEFGPEYELNDVARILPVDTAQANMGQPYVPYTVPRDRIPYPRPDFVDRLMSLKEPGDVILLRDKPATTVFVAVLEERSDPIMSGAKPNLSGFLEEYRNAEKRGSLWQQQFIVERRRAYIREVEKQMRIDATGGKVDEQGNIILPEGIVRGNDTDTSD